MNKRQIKKKKRLRRYPPYFDILLHGRLRWRQIRKFWDDEANCRMRFLESHRSVYYRE